MYNGNKPLSLLEMEVSGLDRCQCWLLLHILRQLNPPNHSGQPFSVWKTGTMSTRTRFCSTLPVGNAQALTKQSAWDRPLIEHDKAEVWSAYTDPCSRARLIAVSTPHTGDWLMTMPISSCGLCIAHE